MLYICVCGWVSPTRSLHFYMPSFWNLFTILKWRTVYLDVNYVLTIFIPCVFLLFFLLSRCWFVANCCHSAFVAFVKIVQEHNKNSAARERGRDTKNSQNERLPAIRATTRAYSKLINEMKPGGKNYSNRYLLIILFLFLRFVVIFHVLILFRLPTAICRHTQHTYINTRRAIICKMFSLKRFVAIFLSVFIAIDFIENGAYRSLHFRSHSNKLRASPQFTVTMCIFSFSISVQCVCTKQPEQRWNCRFLHRVLK